MFCFGQFCDAYLPILDGVVMVVKHYAEILNREYGKCTIVVPQVPKYEDTDSFEVIRVKSVPIPQRSPYRFAVAELHKKSVDKIALTKFDLIHTHSPFGLGQYGLKIAKRRGLPIVSTFHSKYYDDFKQALKFQSFAQLVVNSIVNYYNHLDQVWTVGKSTADTLREYGYKGNIEIIMNGSDTYYPENAKRIISDTRKKYNLSKDVPTFLFVGQHIWQKNIKHLVQATAYLKKSGFEFKMIMTGIGYAFDDIKKLVADYELTDSFIFTGQISRREDLTALYLTADMFMFPSVYDNTPLVIKEAAGLKTPSLVIAGSNAAEGIHDMKNGFLTKNDPEEIGKKVITIFNSDIDINQVGENAMKTLPVAWDSIVEDVYRRYLELIKYKNRLR